MNRRTNASMVALCVAVAVLSHAAGAAARDVSTVMRLMPDDLTVSVVISDLESLDKSLEAFVKRIDSNAGYESLVAKVKSEFGIGDWIDFSKPMGAAQSVAGQAGGTEVWLIWAVVPESVGKVKSIEGASEEAGVWHIPFDGRDDLYIRVQGDYVIAATSKEALARAKITGKSLADELKGRMDLLEGRDALLHLNVDSVRPMALAGIAQVAQMAPMMAMMAAQQGGTDPAAMTSMFTGLFDGIKKFVEQVAYVDVTIAIDAEAADATIATGYVDGAIKAYLGKQKPASVPPFAKIEEQPYSIAGTYHFPGTESPFFDYVLDKMIAAAPAAPGAPAEGAAPAGGGEAMGKAAEAARDLYRKVQGMSFVAAMTPDGTRASGAYYGSDLQGIMALAVKSMTTSVSSLQQLTGGATYDALGVKKIGNTTVEEFVLKFDTSNPKTATAAQFYGPEPHYALGISDGCVRFGLGPAQYMNRVFDGKADKPLGSSRLVKEALTTLPAKRNAVVLIDALGLIPVIGPMLGLPKAEAGPPAPPIAISFSLAGEPARLDIHVPSRSIGRLKQAVQPKEPL